MDTNSITEKLPEGFEIIRTPSVFSGILQPKVKLVDSVLGQKKKPDQLPAFEDLIKSDAWLDSAPDDRRTLYQGYKRRLEKQPSWKKKTKEERFAVTRNMERQIGMFGEFEQLPKPEIPIQPITQKSAIPLTTKVKAPLVLAEPEKDGVYESLPEGFSIITESEKTPISRGVGREWEEEKESVWGKAKDIALGSIEAGGALAAGLLTLPIAGLAGLTGLPFGKANEWLEKTGEFSANIFQPRTEMGKEITGVVSVPFQWIHDASRFYGDIVYDKTNSPNLAAGVATIFELASYALLAKGVKGVKGKLKPSKVKALPMEDMLKALEEMKTEPAKVLINEIKKSPKQWQQWRKTPEDLGVKIVKRAIPEITKKIEAIPKRKPLVPKVEPTVEVKKPLPEAKIKPTVEEKVKEVAEVKPKIKEPAITRIEQRQAEIDIKYAPVLGTRIKDGGIEWEFVANNDIGIPYFSKVVKGKVQKKQFTVSGYKKEWLDKQLESKVAPKIELIPKPGYVWIKNKQKPFTEYREIIKGKDKDKIKVTLTDGKKVTVGKDAVRVWPEERKPVIPIKEIKRGIKEIATDANILLGKEGAISFRKTKLTPDQIAAKERLVKDIDVFKDRAAKAGKEFEQYLKDEGLPANMVKAISDFAKQKDIAIAKKEDLLPETTVEKMYDATDMELERLGKPSVVSTYHKLKRAVADVSGNVKKKMLKEGGQAGKEAVIRHDLIRGAGPKAERLINEASDKIYGGLSKINEKTLNRIIQSRRIIVIEGYKPEIKHPLGLGAKEHQAYLDTLPRETLTKLNRKADLYFAEMRNQLGQLKQKGLITDESYQALIKAGDYSPRQFLQHIDPEKTYTFGGKKITVSDSGIRALEAGSEGLLQNNSRALLAQVVTRTQARIFRNEANQALHKLAIDVPDNGVVRLAGKEKAPTGFEKVSVMIDGQSKEMLMPLDMAREWIINDPAINTQMANIIGWMSGSKVLKPMATGLNPEFAVTNMPRDIVHVWLTTHEYSPHMPIWMAQMGRDFVVTAKDAFTRKGAWIDYIDEGGGMSFLTHQGRITKGSGILGKLQNVLGYAGETSEIWTRLALRKRALRNGKAPFEATWEARNYLDFSQGGWFIKGADTGIPYLNASIQATRGLARSASQKPLEFVYKSAELVGLSTGLYLANRYTNPECLKSVSDRDKVNNFIITTPFTYTDKNNEKRHLYFKIAKDQSQRLMCTIFENAVAKYLGEDINIDQVTQAAQDLIPIIPTQTVPPSMDAMLGYYANKDFWMNKNIWRGPEVKPSEEYTRFTHPTLVKLGKTGLSPERTRYVLENFFTYGNIYTSMVGGGLRQIMDKLPGDVKESTTEEMLVNMPFVRKVLKSTHPYSKHRKELEDIKITESTKRYRKTRDLDALCEIYYKNKNKTAKENIRTFIKEQPPEDRMRLHERFIRYGGVYNIPDRRWWLNLGSLTPEARATVYWTRWQQAGKEEKERLEKQLPKIPGIMSDRFGARLQQLRKNPKKPIPLPSKKEIKPAIPFVGMGKK